MKKTLRGRDGSRMLLTGDIEKAEDIRPFYMDEQKVTNFLFVEFLNSLEDDLSVKSGVVRHGETIINYIGNGSSEEDAIVFEHNRFHLKDQGEGSKPVVRVTYHGAHLYAAGHGKGLLSEKEWKYAYRYHSDNSESKEKTTLPPGVPVTANMMHVAVPSVPEEEEVLDGMGRDIKEWVKLPQDSVNGKPASPDGVSKAGVLDAARLDSASPLKRSPWEGFADVGFRTKVTIDIGR